VAWRGVVRSAFGLCRSCPGPLFHTDKGGEQRVSYAFMAMKLCSGNSWD